MKVKAVFCQLILSSILFLANAQAATYYVATTGSDSNPGTSTQPFRTITYAYGKASAGTTILVAPGTYTDYTTGWGLHLSASGTASSPITLKSQTPGGAILDGQFGSSRHSGIYLDGSYNIIDGFVIMRSPITGIYVAGNNNQVLNDEIENNGTQGSSDPEGQGIYSSDGTSGNIYEGNYIHDNGYAGSNLDHGLYLCGQNEVVANNVVIRQPSRGLQIAGYSSVSGMKVYNNVFAYNGVDGITVWMTMNGVDIRNNICFANGRNGVEFYAATGSGITVDHNVIYGNASANYSFTDGGTTASYTLGTTISSDPKLAVETSSGFDAHLQSASPAINAGVNLYSIITTDFAGDARPASGSWDIGAFVTAATAATPTPPTVSVTAPANGATVSGASVSVSASASSSTGIASVQFKLDGANFGSAITAAPYSTTWNSDNTANGTHTLTAVATDTSGNQTTATTVTVTVNNSNTGTTTTTTSTNGNQPAVAITSPVNGAGYSAPAAIKLTASVNANGHKINKVQYYNGSALLGSSATAPYTVTWTNVSAAIYNLDSMVIYDTSNNVASPFALVTVTNAALSFAATAGTITGPFYITNNNAIVQSAYTTLAAGGKAVYNFTITKAGNYVVSAVVNAPSQDYNSFFVNIDTAITDPTMVWDIPVTSGFSSETVSWRGNGVVSTTTSSGMTAQYAPKVFHLTAGAHHLTIRGREGLTQLSSVSITSTSLPAN